MIWAFLFSFGAGVLAATCLPDAGFTGLTWDLTPWNFPVFAATIGLLYKNVRQTEKRHYAALHGFLWAFGYFTMGLNWVGNALLVDGNPYAWAYPFALMGLPLLLSPFLAVALFVTHTAIRTTPPVSSALIFVAAFSLAEWARGNFFTGFPWNLPGMFWSNTLPIFQSLSIVGIYGLTLLTLLWAIAVMQVFQKKPSTSQIAFIGFVALSFLACVTYGLIAPPTRGKPGTPFQAVLVQANIPQSEKWNTDKFADHFAAHLAVSVPQSKLENLPTIIVWPETALPPEYVDAPAIRQQIANLLSVYPENSYLLTGAIRVEQKDSDWAYYNSLVAYDRSGTIVATSDKFHLVPFGEYMPFREWIPIGPITQFEGMEFGQGPRTITLPGLPPFSPLVCYEVIFPGAVTDRNNPPAFIVNVTNDSWYGDSAGPRQHLAQARARAIEEGIPMIRVAETGISTAIKKNGHSFATINYNKNGQKIMKVEPNAPHTTTAYIQWGDMPFFITLVLIFIPALRKRFFYP